MITVGVDAHKQLHVAVALDAQGQELGSIHIPNDPTGWQDFGTWLSPFNGDVRIGVEGAWGYGRSFTQWLVAHGFAVFEVNARWTAFGRRSARRQDKNDLRDARAVANVLRQEGDRLPRVELEDDTAVLDLLSNERDAVLAEATRLRNQLHALLPLLDPHYQRRFPNLKSQAVLRELEVCEFDGTSMLDQERAASVHRLARRVRLALEEAEALGKRIRNMAAERFSPLTSICGISLLTAGALAGILGPGMRFLNDAQLAAFAGVSPRETSSAGRLRHRLNRGGHRRLNAILYRIALTQSRHSEEAQAYLARRISDGKSKREAIRALKRFIVRALWRAWIECRQDRLTSGALSGATFGCT